MHKQISVTLQHFRCGLNEEEEGPGAVDLLSAYMPQILPLVWYNLGLRLRDPLTKQLTILTEGYLND